MEFASMQFIWVFLPITLLFCFFIRLCVRNTGKKLVIENIFLLFFSLIFYAAGGAEYLSLIVILLLSNYYLARFIEHCSSLTVRKLVFILTILFNCLILSYYKYFQMITVLFEIFSMKVQGTKNFLITLLTFEGNGSISASAPIIPLALSFIVFQTLSYIADVYKHKISAEKNILYFSLYILFFAQLSQGPIMRYSDLGSQIRNRSFYGESFSHGISRFCYGLGKKVIIANTIAAVSDKIWSMDIATQSTAEAWLGMFLYSLQIYYDFSGYSDMAVGIGSMFGFTIPENFNYPYTAVSIQDFWRRWHISLSTWFKDYIYIPLGGSRQGTARTCLNLLTVFFITGLWHGANLNFIFWGLYFAFFIILERLFLGKLLKRNPVKLLNRLYTLLVVMFGWVFFRAPNLYYAIKYIKIMFHHVPQALGTSLATYFNQDLFLACFFGLVCLGGFHGISKKLFSTNWSAPVLYAVRTVIQFFVLLCSILLIIGGSYNPSIYGAF